jgi:hypothetical protein
MRTKKLLLTAAVGLVATATSFAQIYSVNAVGYVNVTVPADGTKLALLANPLNGTNNDLNTILPLTDLNIGTTVYLWDEVTQNYVPCDWYGTAVGWLPNETVPPGRGFFLKAFDPAGTLNITFVGEVPQGHLVNTLPAGPALGLKSSIVPQAGTLDELAFPGEMLDTVYLWDVNAQDWVPQNHYGEGVGWLPNNPVQVAQAFFVQKALGNTGLNWVRDFSVNP